MHWPPFRNFLLLEKGGSVGRPIRTTRSEGLGGLNRNGTVPKPGQPTSRTIVPDKGLTKVQSWRIRGAGENYKSV
jgi:hypothetical protein